MYFRQVGEAIGIGSYRHEPLVVEADDILDHEEAPIAPAEMPFTPDHFESGMAAAREVLPSLEGAGLARKFNGLFSFTTDGFPVLGESPAGARVLVGAGRVDHPRRRRRQSGRRVDRERRADHRPSRVRHQALPPTRAQPPLCPGAGRAAVPRGVRHHPPAAADATNPRNIRLTPFYARQRELGAVFFENAGWERPQWFDANQGLLDSLPVTGESRAGWAAREWSPTVAAEHVATRERAALFDLSPFAKFEVTGRRRA